MTFESKQNANKLCGHPRLMLLIILSALSALIPGLTGCDRSASGGKPAADKEAHGSDNHSDAAKGTQGETHADEVVLTPDAIRRNNVRVGKAGERLLTATLIAPARAAYNAESMAHVGVFIRGRVTEIRVRLGDTVKKGDILFVIESTELGEAQSEYLQKRTALDIAKPAIELAQSAYDRAKILYEKQGETLTEVQKRLGDLKAADGALRSAESALMGAAHRLQLLGMDTPAVEELAKNGKLTPTFLVRAPVDGRIIEKDVTLGEQINPDDQKMLTLADLGTIWLLADVPELSLHQISPNGKVEITVPALGDRTFPGTVSYVHPELDPATRTARVRVEVKNPENALLPGMFASVRMDMSSAYPAAILAVPEDAIQRVEGAPAVFVPVAGEENTFTKRPVSVGRSVNGWVPVLEGLKKDESYVVSGSFILKAELGKASGTHEH